MKTRPETAILSADVVGSVSRRSRSPGLRNFPCFIKARALDLRSRAKEIDRQKERGEKKHITSGLCLETWQFFFSLSLEFISRSSTNIYVGVAVRQRHIQGGGGFRGVSALPAATSHRSPSPSFSPRRTPSTDDISLVLRQPLTSKVSREHQHFLRLLLCTDSFPFRPVVPFSSSLPSLSKPIRGC